MVVQGSAKTVLAALIIPGLRRMSEKPMTVAETARLAGQARAAKYTRKQLREFARGAGWPAKLDKAALSRLRALLRSGKTQRECAELLGVSVRTVGRAVSS